jgi:predicted alpha/beta superfamily hydrolase
MSQAIEEGWFDENTEQVGVRGDQHPLSWDKTYFSTRKTQTGLYELTIPFDFDSDSIELSYKIKVEGTGNPDDGWQKGLNHRLIIHKNKSSTIMLRWEDSAHAKKPTLTGNVQVIHNFKSEFLPKRDIYIYLPPSYSNSNKNYRVLYMQDGQNIFDASHIGQEWGLDEAAEKLIESKQIEPLIIIGIANTSDRIAEYTPTPMKWEYTFQKKGSKDDTHKPIISEYETEEGDLLKVYNHSDSVKVIIPEYNEWQAVEQVNDSTFFLSQAGITFSSIDNANTIVASKEPMGGKGDLYEQLIIKELKPYIDGKYRTKKEAQHTALGGSSLGGLISLHIGLQHPEIFGKLIIASPSLWWDKAYMLNYIQTLTPNKDQKMWLYIGSGEGEQAVSNVNKFNEYMLNMGWPENAIQYLISENAQHNETAWKQQANNILQFVLAE